MVSGHATDRRRLAAWTHGRRVLRATIGAIRARAGLFVLILAAIVTLNLLVPPLVLSAVRKPYDYFSINPWLHNIPSWLRSGEATAGRKVSFLWDAAVLWFVASGQYDEAEWGFTVTVRDFARWILMGVLFGAYFTLWLQRRAQLKISGVAARGRGSHGGVLGALLSTLGFTTMPCSVVGCGAPVLPVVGLALTGLSSGTIALLSGTSRFLVWIVMTGVAVGTVVLAGQVATGEIRRSELGATEAGRATARAGRAS